MFNWIRVYFMYFLLNTNACFGPKTQSSYPPRLHAWQSRPPSQQPLAKIFKRTRREWEKSTDGGVGGLSVREREKEIANFHTLWSSMAVFIHSRHDPVGAIFVLLKNLFSMSIKGSGDEGRLHESLLINKFSMQPQLQSYQRSENVKHYTQSAHIGSIL